MCQLNQIHTNVDMFNSVNTGFNGSAILFSHDFQW